MATWEDGPEYAPVQPPDQFTVPDVAPLSVASPAEDLPPVPGDRPRFGDPDRPVAALTTLDPGSEVSSRDPYRPFDVEAGTMTDSSPRGGAWGAAHWRPPTGAPIQPAAQFPGPAAGSGPTGPSTAPTASPGPWGPPHATTHEPTSPIAVHSSAAQPVAGMPAPGTADWFGPGPSGPAQQQRPSTWSAIPAGVKIMLLLSVFWFPAPYSFVAAFILSARARYARRPILIAFTVIGLLILLIATVSTLSNYGDLGFWYVRLSSWSLAGSIVVAVLMLIFTSRDLDRVFGRDPNREQ